MPRRLRVGPDSGASPQGKEIENCFLHTEVVIDLSAKRRRRRRARAVNLVSSRIRWHRYSRPTASHNGDPSADVRKRIRLRAFDR